MTYKILYIIHSELYVHFHIALCKWRKTVAPFFLNNEAFLGDIILA